MQTPPRVVGSLFLATLEDFFESCVVGAFTFSFAIALLIKEYTPPLY
ncbi:hypothetical protein SAMN04488527_1403 [Aliiroseovarius crassostreae]|nr:hypothetical protein SAMN04488527_1403 [Aliiroseovarius crassostreae]